MILAAHQPNFIPWIGYFHKMARADKFVLADDVQYTTHGFINRNHIKTVNGKQWLTVPVITKGRGLQKINEVRIDKDQDWQRRHWNSLQTNYKYAPYFDYYADFFERLYQKEWVFLVDLNITLIEFVREALNISCPVILSSELDLTYGLVESSEATERIVDMVKKTGCAKYLSGESGKKYLNEKLFEDAGIELIYADFAHPKYHQQFGEFVSHLSIIDLLFNEGVGAGKFVKAPNENLSG
jgi:hypothetical protein